MAIAVMVLISLVDILFHRIPNRLIACLAILIAPHCHIHLLFISVVMVVFLVTDLGAGDLKFAIVGSLYPMRIDTSISMAVFAISGAISLFLWRKEGSVPLAPALSAVILCNS